MSTVTYDLLCPMCARDYQNDSGFCSGCESDDAVESYSHESAEQVSEHVERWRGWMGYPRERRSV